MSITKKGSKKANNEEQKGKYFERYVVPETAIRDFIGSLSIRDIDAAAARLQIVADVTGDRIDDHLDRSDLRRIKQIGRESANQHYRRIMSAIIASVEQGPRGIDAAHLTASRAVELAFSWTLSYFSALGQYRETLRKMRQAVKSN